MGCAVRGVKIAAARGDVRGRCDVDVRGVSLHTRQGRGSRRGSPLRRVPKAGRDTSPGRGGSERPDVSAAGHRRDACATGHAAGDADDEGGGAEGAGVVGVGGGVVADVGVVVAQGVLEGAEDLGDEGGRGEAGAEGVEVEGGGEEIVGFVVGREEEGEVGEGAVELVGDFAEGEVGGMEEFDQAWSEIWGGGRGCGGGGDHVEYG